MTITVDATFKDGALRLTQPVDLPEGAKVRLSITSEDAGGTVANDKDRAALVARGRELIHRARERNYGVPADVIRREIEQEIEAVRRRPEV